MSELYSTIGTRTYANLLADPQGADVIAIPCKPGNGEVAAGTVMYREASGLYSPAAAANVVATNQLVVLKNNAPAAVILSPAEYSRLMEMEEDYHLLLLAQERLANTDMKKARSMEEVMKDLGITQEEIDETEDVEIE